MEAAADVCGLSDRERAAAAPNVDERARASRSAGRGEGAGGTCVRSRVAFGWRTFWDRCGRNVHGVDLFYGNAIRAVPRDDPRDAVLWASVRRIVFGVSKIDSR